MRAVGFCALGITSAHIGYGIGTPIFWALMGCGIVISMATEIACTNRHNQEMEVD